ncbi:MAG TPA: hypothetical protein VJR27_00660 [Candidatus Saccharimonadales bacterium]|nr:hypothetical protein [Candidatus Saccharimonadales bacterium]
MKNAPESLNLTSVNEQSFDHSDQTRGQEMAHAELNKFASNEGLDDLANLYSTELPQDTHDKLATLQELGVANWDFRKGAERQATNWDNAQLGEAGSPVWNAVFAGANKLGLVESGELQNKNPKYLAILGGANKAPLDRLRFGLESVDNFEHVVYLGSSRPVSDVEREKAKDYAPNAQTEYDLGSGAFETVLGGRLVDEFTEVRGDDTWGTRVYEFEHNGQTKTGFVLSTPTTIAGRRATTYDNYKFFADRAELADDPDATVAAITTGFYSQGQHFPAIQELTLPHGTQVETIGHNAEYSGVQRKPSQLLQETKSAVDAAVRLEQAIATAENSAA